jgi:ribosomal protein S27E
MKCPVCKGKRTVYSAIYGKKGCPACGGTGFVKVKKGKKP